MTRKEKTLELQKAIRNYNKYNDLYDKTCTECLRACLVENNRKKEKELDKKCDEIFDNLVTPNFNKAVELLQDLLKITENQAIGVLHSPKTKEIMKMTII